MKAFLEETKIINFSNSDIQKLSKELSFGCKSDVEIAKSHLLAALLRANDIPTGFCYQRLSCSEYKEDIYCLHGLNAIYLKEFGWYKVDTRVNKEGVNAEFNPPIEKLAFEIGENEFNLPDI